MLCLGVGGNSWPSARMIEFNGSPAQSVLRFWHGRLGERLHWTEEVHLATDSDPGSGRVSGLALMDQGFGQTHLAGFRPLEWEPGTMHFQLLSRVRKFGQRMNTPVTTGV